MSDPVDQNQAGQGAATATRYFERFDRVNRILHGTLMTSFLGLTLTGMPLLFAKEAWAARWTHFLGGFEIAGILHRVFAVMMIATFLAHVYQVGRKVIVERDFGVLWGPRSMVARPRDVADLFRHFRWFFGLGPRPRFDRFTYWEKFDYWAVFWGMAIIGGSGLMLWFPVLFATFLPGWMFNIALVVHGEEALLAVGFIFTIHFFNCHLRPEKFPMDTVIFTGRVSEHELSEERPEEYERLVASGRLDELDLGPPDRTTVAAGKLVGSIAVVIGLTMVGLIVSALLR